MTLTASVTASGGLMALPSDLLADIQSSQPVIPDIHEVEIESRVSRHRSESLVKIARLVTRLVQRLVGEW